MSQPEQPGVLPPKPKPPLTAVGVALVVIGMLILIPSGLCTGIFGIGALSEVIANPGTIGDAVDGLLMVLIVGGVPLAIGAGIAIAGWHMRRRD